MADQLKKKLEQVGIWDALDPQSKGLIESIHPTWDPEIIDSLEDSRDPEAVLGSLVDAIKMLGRDYDLGKEMAGQGYGEEVEEEEEQPAPPTPRAAPPAPPTRPAAGPAERRAPPTPPARPTGAPTAQPAQQTRAAAKEPAKKTGQGWLGRVPLPKSRRGWAAVSIAAVLLLAAVVIGGSLLIGTAEGPAPAPLTQAEVVATQFAEGGGVDPGGQLYETPAAPEQLPPVPGQSWWQSLVSLPTPQDRSPFRRGFFDAQSFAAIIFAIATVGLVILDVRARREVHQGAAWFAGASLLQPFVTVPIMNFAAGAGIGWTFLATTSAATLSIGPIGSNIAHKDKTNAASSMALITFLLFLVGTFALPAALGQFFGQNWPRWEGVYGAGGWLILILTLRFREAALTTLLVLLGLAALLYPSSSALQLT